MPRYALESFGPQFFDDAPILVRDTSELPVDSDQVWSELTGDRPLRWCQLLRGGQYATPLPHGVGTIRNMASTGGLLKLREQFISWNDTERSHAFRVTHANTPGLRRFGERYEIRSTTTGCSFTWTFAVEAQPGFGALLHPIIALTARSLIADNRRYFTSQRNGTT